MSYCQANLNGWFDDLVNAGTQIATTAIRQSTPVGYGTATPPMFPPPTYGAPQQPFGGAAGAAINLAQLLPWVAVGVGLWLLMKGRK